MRKRKTLQTFLLSPFFPFHSTFPGKRFFSLGVEKRQQKTLKNKDYRFSYLIRVIGTGPLCNRIKFLYILLGD